MPRFRVFAFLWCAAILVHQLYQGRWLVLDVTAPLTFAALYALCLPGSVRRLCLLSVVHAAVVAFEMPRVSNHWLVMGVTSVAMGLTLLPALRRDGRFAPGTVLGPVRVTLLVVYAFAAFHKLNAGFFDPAGSCGAEHYRRLASALPLLPRGTAAVTSAIWGTLAIEITLPLLLLLPRTRAAAFPLGWLFHAALGWNGYWDFSTMAAAYYAAFLDDQTLAGFRSWGAGKPWLARAAARTSELARNGTLFRCAAALLTASLIVPLGLGAETRGLALAVNAAGRFAWLVGWLALGAVWLLAWRGGRRLTPRGPESGPERAWWRHPALWLAPLLVAANGCSPYLGLKSESSYAMFSNLRTEGPYWNHYLVPRAARLLPYSEELVRIVRSEDPRLARLARGRFALVPVELRRQVARRPDLPIVYARDGEVVHAPRAGADPFLAEPLGLVERKLVLFRPVAPRNVCLH